MDGGRAERRNCYKHPEEVSVVGLEVATGEGWCFYMVFSRSSDTLKYC